MTEDREIGSCIYDYPEQIGVAVGFKDLKPIHGEWIRDIVWGNGDYTLMAHRGSFKSSCLAVAIALIMVIYPTINIIFLRKADNDVSEMIRMVKKILQSSVMRDICAVFHDGVALELTEDAQDHISTNLWTSPMGASQILGIGLKSSITGKHADLVITDDICNVTDRISKAERDRTKIQYQELQNIRNRGGRIINLGTKWHKDDVFSLMDNIHVYDYKQTGLITEEKARELRDSMTAALFACNYELKIIADDDVIFVSPHVNADPALVEQGIVHIDAAYGGSDFTAFTACRRRDGVYYVYGRLWHRAVDELEDEIIRLRKKFLCGKIHCETNADKGYLAKSLRSKGERVVSYAETENKYMKIVTNLKPAWKNVVFVTGTDPEYIDQICDYNDEAEHDDAPDSLASIIRIMGNKQNVGGEEAYKSIYGGVYR